MSDQIAQDFIQVGDDIFIDPVTGDFRAAYSDTQHIMDIIASQPGWWKEFPAVGAGASQLLKGKFDVQKVSSVIKEQLEADGYQVARPQISIDGSGNTIIKPNAVRVKF